MQRSFPQASTAWGPSLKLSNEFNRLFGEETGGAAAQRAYLDRRHGGSQDDPIFRCRREEPESVCRCAVKTSTPSG
jgi:hypothetical protein